MAELSPTRVAALVYALYFAVAIAASVIARGDIASLMRGSASGEATAVWVASTAIYAVVVVLLARLVWDVEPWLAVAAAILGLVGCVIQAATSLMGLGRYGPIAALFFFGLFMVLYGSLVIRSTMLPTAIGILLLVGGLGWCTLAVPGFPAALGLVVYAIGGIAEVALAVWLLVRG